MRHRGEVEARQKRGKGNDDTHTAAIKLTNKNTQKLVVVATNGTDTREERYDLSGLKYVQE